MMRKFQFRLQAALDQALRLEEQAALALAELTAQQLREAQTLENLLALSAQLARDLNAQQTGEVDLAEVQAQRHYLEHTWTRLAEQRQLLDDLEQRTALQREHLVQLMQKREVLARLKETQARQHEQEAQAAESQGLDEIGTLSYARQGAAR